MWVCRSQNDGDAEERWLLENEHLLVMGWPIYPEFSTKWDHPLLRTDHISATQKKSLAGNATRMNCMLNCIDSVY